MEYKCIIYDEMGILPTKEMDLFKTIEEKSKYVVYQINEREYKSLITKLKKDRKKHISKKMFAIAKPIILDNGLLKRFIGGAYDGCEYMRDGYLDYCEYIEKVLEDEINSSHIYNSIYTIASASEIKKHYERPQVEEVKEEPVILQKKTSLTMHDNIQIKF